MCKFTKIALAAAILAQLTGSGALAAEKTAAVPNSSPVISTPAPKRAQPQGNFIAFGQGGPARGVIDKSGDKKLQALLAETVPQFKQESYLDPVSGKTLAYNLFVPAGNKPEQKVPLLMFIGDASTVGTDLLRPLKQGYSPAPGFIRCGAFGFRSVGH